MIEVKDNFVSAKHIHAILDSQKAFSTWIKKKIKAAMLVEGNDFIPKWEESNGGRRSVDYMLTIQASEEICILQQTSRGKELRQYLLSLNKKAENNQLLDHKKTALLYQLLNIFKFGDKQLEAEEMHKDRFMLSTKIKGNIHKLFAEYRNDLLNINNEDLKEAVLRGFQNGTIHKATAKNIRGRIALIDRYKLIRNAVADYLISTGASTHNAITFADTVMEVAKIAGVEIRIKDEDTLFEEKENATSPILLGMAQTKLN